MLTFDDGSKSDLYYTAPELERFGFGATFFINNGGGVEASREGDYLSWEEVRRLHDRGFEVANHGKSHPNFAALSHAEALAEIVAVEEQCEAHGIPRPRTFGYPGGHHDRKTIAILEESGETVWREDRYIDGAAGITAATESADSITFTASGGRYHFCLWLRGASSTMDTHLA